MTAREPLPEPSCDTVGDHLEEAPDFVQSLLTAREVASALRVSPMTVYRMVDAGAVRALRVGRQVRIPADEVARYIAAHTSPRPGQTS